MLVISVILTMSINVYRISHERLSDEWKKPYMLYFISTVNSLKHMPAVSGELEKYYFEFYERAAAEHGIYLNITDTGSGIRVEMKAPDFSVNRVI